MQNTFLKKKNKNWKTPWRFFENCKNFPIPPFLQNLGKKILDFLKKNKKKFDPYEKSRNFFPRFWKNGGIGNFLQFSKSDQKLKTGKLHGVFLKTVKISLCPHFPEI